METPGRAGPRAPVPVDLRDGVAAVLALRRTELAVAPHGFSRRLRPVVRAGGRVLALIPQVVEAVGTDVPVVASGGSMDGRGIATEQGRTELLPMLAGQGAGLAGPLAPAAEIARLRVAEAAGTR